MAETIAQETWYSVQGAANELVSIEAEMNNRKAEAMNHLANELVEVGTFSNMSAFLLAMNGVIAVRGQAEDKSDAQNYYEQQEDTYGLHNHDHVFGAKRGFSLNERPNTVHLIPGTPASIEAARGASCWGRNEYSGLRYKITTEGSGMYKKYFGELVVPSLCLPYAEGKLKSTDVHLGEFTAAVVMRGAGDVVAEPPVDHGLLVRAELADWARHYYPAKYAEEAARVAKAEELLLAAARA